MPKLSIGGSHFLPSSIGPRLLRNFQNVEVGLLAAQEGEKLSIFRLHVASMRGVSQLMSGRIIFSLIITDATRHWLPGLVPVIGD
jgi:hypothetical protein